MIFSAVSRRAGAIALVAALSMIGACWPAMAVDMGRLDNQLDGLSAPCEVMHYQMNMDVENAKLQGNLTPDMVTRIYEPLGPCLKDARAKALAVYQAFATASAKKPALKAAGKDVYATWLAQLGTDNGSMQKALYDQAVNRLIVEYETP